MDLQLDPGTLYLVTGENGAGKSTLIEAVAWCLWGKSLRGEHLYGDPCASSVIADGLSVIRTRADSRTELGFAQSAGLGGVLGEEVDSVRRLGGAVHGTAKEAQRSLDGFIGSFERWRRTHVFSSADAAHFSLATDAERKRLIEEFLGLEMLDGAYEQAREQRRNSAAALQASARTALDAVVARNRAQDELARLEREDDPEPEELPLPHGPSESGRLEHDLAVLRARRRTMAADNGAAQAEARRAEQVMVNLAEGVPCQACGRPVTSAELDAAREDSELAHHRAKHTAWETQELDEHLGDQQAALEGRVALAQARDQERILGQARAQERADWATRAGRRSLWLAEAQETLAAAERELALAREQEARDRQEAATCEAQADVLGLRGVRAGVLSGALAAAEDLANVWMGRLGRPGLRVALKPYTEKAGGGAVDSISLELGGRRYRSASGGERRRADVALLLALGELAAGASGRPRGTLFLDECFDCLDQAGQESVVGSLLELAQAGPSVVVVTHSGVGELLKGKRGVVHLRVDGGRVERVTSAS